MSEETKVKVSIGAHTAFEVDLRRFLEPRPAPADDLEDLSVRTLCDELGRRGAVREAIALLSTMTAGGRQAKVDLSVVPFDALVSEMTVRPGVEMMRSVNPNEFGWLVTLHWAEK